MPTYTAFVLLFIAWTILDILVKARWDKFRLLKFKGVCDLEAVQVYEVSFDAESALWVSVKFKVIVRVITKVEVVVTMTSA